MNYKLEALLASMEHLCKKAKASPAGTITLPASGTGTEGKFVLVTTNALETLLAIAKPIIKFVEGETRSPVPPKLDNAE